MTDSEIVFAIQESPEGGYETKALGHSIHTQAETLDELKGMVQDAVPLRRRGQTQSDSPALGQG